VVDWTGALRSSFQLPPNDAAGNGVTVTASPDGRVALLSNGTVIDYTGATVGRLIPPPLEGVNAQRWAEDDHHLCSASLAPASVVLTMVDTSGAARPVAVLPDPAWNEGMPATSQWSRQITVVACSQANDRAVIVRETDAPPVVGDGPWSVWSVQVSTGRVISRLDLTGHQLVVSADGSRLIYRPVTGYKPRNLQPPSRGMPPVVVHDPVLDDLTVVDLDTGRSIGKLPPSDQQVLGLSADGRMAVISRESPKTSPQDGIRLVDLASGRTVLSRQGVEPGAMAIDPLSGELMVETASLSNAGSMSSLGLLLIDASGRCREISTGFAPGEVQHLATITH
jgi:hypothetical protein